MILRRITAAFRKQDWFTVGIETMIVVLGVFLGIQLGNWNQSRADAREYAKALDRLRGEIDANLKTLDLADADLAGGLPRVRGALDALLTCLDDAETREAVNAGVGIIFGTAGIRLRNTELDALTSDPLLLAQESPEFRRGLSDLKFVSDLIEDNARGFEAYPQDGRVEKIPGLAPGPRTERRVTYLGITFDNDQRPLRLDGPVSTACKNSELVGALWAWDRTQSNIPLLTAKMRASYKDALASLDAEAGP